MGGPLTSDATDALGALEYCYLTTLGRVSGDPHEIEIWFALDGGVLYMLSGGGDRSDWVQNLRANTVVTIRLGSETRSAPARVIAADTDEDALARRLLVQKYRPRYSGELDEWGRTALPVAVAWAAGSLV